MSESYCKFLCLQLFSLKSFTINELNEIKNLFTQLILNEISAVSFIHEFNLVVGNNTPNNCFWLYSIANIFNNLKMKEKFTIDILSVANEEKSSSKNLMNESILQFSDMNFDRTDNPAPIIYNNVEELGKRTHIKETNQSSSRTLLKKKSSSSSKSIGNNKNFSRENLSFKEAEELISNKIDSEISIKGKNTKNRKSAQSAPITQSVKFNNSSVSGGSLKEGIVMVDDQEMENTLEEAERKKKILNRIQSQGGINIFKTFSDKKINLEK